MPLATRRTTALAIAALVTAGLPAAASAAITFAPRQDHEVSPGGTRAVATGDLNGDGRDDVVGVNLFENTVSVLLAHEGGGLDAPVHYEVGNVPTDVVVADLSGDGNPDVATANLEGFAQGTHGTVSVLRGSPDGDLTPWTTVQADEGVRAIAAADLDGDGALDLATVSAGGLNDSTAVLLQHEEGFGPFTVLDHDDNPVGIVAAKLDDDASVDLATSHSVGFVQPRLGTGDGTFSPGLRVNLPPGPPQATPLALTAADVDGDGDVDLPVAIQGSSTVAHNVTILRGNGDGGFEAVGPPVTVGNNPNAIVAADLSGDGRPDLVTATSGGGSSVSVLENSGDGSFERVLDPPLATRSVDVAAGDVDGDGRPDIVSAGLVSGGARDVSVLRNTTDVTAPQIAILSPTQGAVYRRGQRVLADYACVDEEEDATGVASCEGTVPNGSPIDTSRAGTHEFTVFAVDNHGNERRAVVTYRVQAPPSPPRPNLVQQLLNLLRSLLAPR